MLWSDDFIYLHAPKTAGKSLTRYFLSVWPRPIHGYIAKGQFAEIADLDPTDLHLEAGRGHEGMHFAWKLFEERGVQIRNLKAIFVSVRNPYDLMVSNYFFQRETYERWPEARSNANFRLAASTDFDEYCRRSTAAPDVHWLKNGSHLPRNLRLIRFERLNEEIPALAREFGWPDVAFPHLNPSRRDDFHQYLTPETERLIYERYRYFFDYGLYPRETFPEADRGRVSEQPRRHGGGVG